MTNATIIPLIPPPSRFKRAIVAVVLACLLVVPVLNWATGVAVVLWHLATTCRKGARGAVVGVATTVLAFSVTLAVVAASISRAARGGLFVPDFWLFLAGYGSVTLGTLALFAFRRVALRSQFLARGR